jgi:hypothetical protein
MMLTAANKERKQIYNSKEVIVSALKFLIQTRVTQSVAYSLA